jgi:hypothetical protein
LGYEPLFGRPNIEWWSTESEVSAARTFSFGTPPAKVRLTCNDVSVTRIRKVEWPNLYIRLAEHFFMADRHSMLRVTESIVSAGLHHCCGMSYTLAGMAAIVNG